MADTMPPASDIDSEARQWRAMVEDARRLHQPSVRAAGEYADGTCAYCQDDPRLVRLARYRDYLNGSRTKVWMHDHPDPWPVCNTCAAGYEDRADWPCPTAAALGLAPTALGFPAVGN